MTRKSYAAIKCAQECMTEIQKIAENAASGEKIALSRILSIARKWNKDFQDCDPTWRRTTEEPSAQQKALAMGAFIQQG